MRAVLVDTGPLVALMDRSDPDHGRCTQALRRLRDPLVTVWPVITEAMYLLGQVSWRAQDALWQALEAIPTLALGDSDAQRMRALMAKYRDLPMDLADAAIVAVAERERIRSVFTLDARDFGLYRPARLSRFALIP